MKTRLITLLTMGRTVDRARDRKGAYTLRYVNKFPKFGPVARAAAAGPPRAGHSAPSAQSSLFEAAKAPAAAAPAKSRPDRPDPTDQTAQPNQPQQPRPPKVRFRWFAKLGAFLAAAAAVVPKTAARVRGRLRSPAADPRPRAQGELALEKVTVLRNDLSDADLVVVAVQPKPEDSRAVQADSRAPDGNTWTRVTARWIKLKNPAEDGSQASAASEAPAGRAAEWAQTPP